MTSTAEWQWLKGEVRAAAASFSEQLRSIEDGTVKVPNLDWDVNGLAAHVISLPGFYRELTTGTEPFEFPDDFASFSISVRAHITETDTAVLADMVEAAVDELFEVVGDDPDGAMTMYNQPTSTMNTTAGFLSELLLHGRDLAALTGVDVPISRRAANAIIPATMALAPVFVDPEEARKVEGTYHITFRGGREYTWVVADGVLTVSDGKPAKADARLLADPVEYVLLSLGRANQYKAGLTGRVIAYGRKPWRFFALGNIAVDGV